MVAISTRALFDLNREDRIFRRSGAAGFVEYQKRKVEELISKGPSFGLIVAFQSLNKLLGGDSIEVVLVSRNSPSAAMRVRKSLDEYGISIERYWFTSGDPVAPYLSAASADLFLSADAEDVKAAHANGFAAALVLGTPQNAVEVGADSLRIAFDGDAVLFAEDSEEVYKNRGLDEFLIHEQDNAETPMRPGPFANVLKKLGELQKGLPESCRDRLKVGLFTARNAPADLRVLTTMEEWGVNPDHMAFLGGVSKEKSLAAFSPHIYFDDQSTHLIPISRSHCAAIVPSSFVDLSDHTPSCPKCGQPMVRRLARRGENQGKEFWGCCSFPRCIETVSIA